MRLLGHAKTQGPSVVAEVELLVNAKPIGSCYTSEVKVGRGVESSVDGAYLWA